MNVITDLEADLAMAFFVEKRHHRDIDPEGVLDLISRVKSALRRVDDDCPAPNTAKTAEPNN